MIARRFALFVLVGWLGVGLGCSLDGWPWRSGSSDDIEQEDEKPHVLLLTVDTLRRDRLGYAGHGAARTPTLDGLAAQGTVFSRAHTPTPRTTPGLATIMTGLWPHRHGSREVREPMHDGLRTLPLAFQERGYDTIAFSANPAAGSSENLDIGFRVLEAPVDRRDRRAGKVTDRVLEMVEESDSDQPLFLWVHYYDPHFAYDPPRPWRSGGPGPCDRLSDIRPRGRVTANLGGVAAEALTHCRQRYDEEIAYVDDAIGRLLEGLRKARGERSWRIVFTSDHGDNQGEDDLWFQHGPSLHEGSVGVPLFFVGEGAAPGEVDGQVARLEDVAPTVLAWLGLPDDAIGPSLDGVSLLPRLARSGRPSEEPPLAFAESAGALLAAYHHHVFSGRPGQRHCINDGGFALCAEPGQPASLHRVASDPDRLRDVSDDHAEVRVRLEAAKERLGPHNTRSYSVRDGPWKLLDEVRFDGERDRRLVHIGEDPAERTDRSLKNPEVRARLNAALDQWLAEVPDYDPGGADPEDDELLKALGYVE